MYSRRDKKTFAFTLIELSVVLVVIGLIVGGILVGRDLLIAATARAQISQIQRYTAAVNMFKTKYSYLPGDVPPARVTRLAFTAVPTRSGESGRSNGDGIIAAYTYGYLNSANAWGMNGENLFFWADLSTNSGLISGSFNTITDAGITVSTNTGFAPYLPAAAIGAGNYIDVTTVAGSNYFQIIYPLQVSTLSEDWANTGMTVQQAAAIDTKMDDGLPTSGTVMARIAFSHLNGVSLSTCGSTSCWMPGVFMQDSIMSAATASATTCFDTTSGQYSMNQKGGANANCALSFRMQSN